MQNEPNEALSDAQAVRKEAVLVAREALASRFGSSPVITGVGLLPEHRDVRDLLDVAVYIESGINLADLREGRLQAVTA